MSKKTSYITIFKKHLDKKCSISSKPSASHRLFAGGETQTEAGRESREMLQVWVQYRTFQELKLCPTALRYSVITISNVCPIHSFLRMQWVTTRILFPLCAKSQQNSKTIPVLKETQIYSRKHASFTKQTFTECLAGVLDSPFGLETPWLIVNKMTTEW